MLAELSTNEVLAGSAEPDSMAHDFTCHMQAIFSLLRVMRGEDLSAGGPRKYPKTAGFGCRMDSAHWNVLHPILKQIEVSSDIQREELVDPFVVLDTDSSGFPIIFCRALSGNVSRARSSSLGSASQRHPQSAMTLRGCPCSSQAQTQTFAMASVRPTTWTTTTATICRLWRIALLPLHPIHEIGPRLSSCHRRRL